MRHVDRIALRVTVMTRRAISCYGRSKMITVFAQKYIDDDNQTIEFFEIDQGQKKDIPVKR